MAEHLPGVATVISNFVGFATAIKAYKYGHGIVPLIYIFSVIASSFYHACDWWAATCIARYQLLRDVDFVFAQSIITTNAMLLIHWVSPDPDAIAYPVGVPFLQTAFLLFYVLMNALLVATTDSGFIVQGVVFLASFGVVVVYLLVYRCRFGRYPKYNMESAVPAVVLSATSIMLFVFQNSLPRYYGWIHSAWHVLAYGGGWYWVSVMPVYDALLNIGAKMDVPPMMAVAATVWRVMPPGASRPISASKKLG